MKRGYYSNISINVGRFLKTHEVFDHYHHVTVA